MTHEPEFEQYIEALRDDLPSVRDEMRIRHRMAGAGIAVAATVATKTAAGATGIAKVGLLPTLMTRLANLPLLTQLGLVTAGTAAVATGPVVVVSHFISRPAVTHAAMPQKVALSDVVRHQAPRNTSAANHATAHDVSEPNRDGAPNRSAAPVGNPAPNDDVAPGGNAVSSSSVRPSNAQSSVPANIALDSPVDEVTGALASRSTRGETTAERQQGSPGDERTTKRNAAVRNPATAQEGATHAAPARTESDAHRVDGTATMAAPAEATDSRSAAADSSQLAEETRLIDAALSSIRNGHLTMARRLLDEHASRFPHAKLAKERGRAIQKLQEAQRHAPP